MAIAAIEVQETAVNTPTRKKNMDTDKIVQESLKQKLADASERIRTGVEDNLRYSHLAKKDTMHIKTRSVHAIYENRMLRLNELVQREMDLLDKNIESFATVLSDVARIETESPTTLDSSIGSTAPESVSHQDTIAEVVPEAGPVRPTPGEMQILTNTDELVSIDKAVVHGKLSTYSVHKCRCTLCKTAKSEEGVKYRARVAARKAAAKLQKEKSANNG